MRCDVCESPMDRWDLPPSPWCREIWTCTWCHAVTQVGAGDYEVLRFPYERWNLRWEAAWSDMLADASRHAYGLRNATLCGIEKSDMEGSQFGMWGGRDDDCPDCTAAAQAIDARWPEDRRAGGFRVCVPAASRPAETGSVRPADELGRADVLLPDLPVGPAGRLLPEPAPAHPETGFRTIGDGPDAVRLPAFWAGGGLGQYRPFDQRERHFAWFQAYPLESVPALDDASFTGDFAWFGDIGEPLDHRTAVTDPIAAKLAEDGLTLPADFVALITRAHLHRCLDRAGDCSWTDVAGPVPSPAHPDDRMVLFFRDQQSCLVWYLYLHRDGHYAVVCSGRDYTTEWGLRYRQDGEIAEPVDELYWCAPGVESFAYRFLIEGTLIQAIRDRRPATELTPEALTYLAHYVPAAPHT
ncbi:hypothetical protein [Actinoplanes sp. DH11]|uniref:hypothetical protein n=1 Tax=Actinoplanes sp. DH11 TaxID=2857011 RepID=UPI001E33C44D|nr:hypothetical protein [Actinoplanes sp. DH11]